MIWGVGVDIVRVSRVGGLLQRWGDRFLRRAYHEAEIATANGLVATNSDRADEFLATRWAVKEGVYKALGDPSVQRVARFPEIRLKPFEATGERFSPVSVELTGGTLEAARAAGIGRVHVSTSHDGEYAVAYVMIERAIA